MSDTPPVNPPDDPAQIRTKLDAALKENRKLKMSNALHESGLGHLNEVQRQALVAVMPKDTEMSADTLKGQATALGFPLTVAPPPTTDPPVSPPPADPSQDANNGQGLPPVLDPGTNFLTPAPNSAHPDPRVAASVAGLTQQEHAHIMALRGGQDSGGLDKAMEKATTKAEAIAAIRQHGGNAGIILDSDLD